MTVSFSFSFSPLQGSKSSGWFGEGDPLSEPGLFSLIRMFAFRLSAASSPLAGSYCLLGKEQKVCATLQRRVFPWASLRHIRGPHNVLSPTVHSPSGSLFLSQGLKGGAPNSRPDPGLRLSCVQ